MLAEGVGGCPLGGPGGRFAGGRWLAELLDLVAKLGLAVDPGPGDVGGSGETAEGDRFSFPGQGLEGLGGSGEGGVVTGSGGLAEPVDPVRRC